MCQVVIAGGPNKDMTALRPYIESSSRIVCADSGADSLYSLDIVPDTVWGDMDSISKEARDWLKENKVPESLFPVEKDMTDSELCVTSLTKEEPILLITSLTGRPDHVMTNLLMAMRLVEEGYKITVTDGVTWVYPLCGENSFRTPVELTDPRYTYSLIPVGSGAQGVSTIGMKYPLRQRNLVCGSSLTVSNELDGKENEHGFDMKAGTMLVMITPKV